MKLDRSTICEAVRVFCGFPPGSCSSDEMLFHWEEISTFLGIGVKASQTSMSSDPLWLFQDEKQLRLVMVAVPPDEFAVLSTTLKEVINYRDRLDAPDCWILTLTEYAALRARGVPQWERFVDLKTRFPKLPDVLDGDLGLALPTRAQFFPVCVDRNWLRRRLSLKSLYISVRRSSASRSRRDFMNSLNKFPASQPLGALRYAQVAIIDTTKDGNTHDKVKVAR